jgi:hypothetical protein
MPCDQARLRTRIRIRAMAEQHVCNIGLPEYGDVDQRSISKFVDGVYIRAMLGEECDAFRKSFDG